jgi:hypothetical protein
MEISEGEEGPGSWGSQELFWAEPNEAACRVEELEVGVVHHGDGAGSAFSEAGGRAAQFRTLTHKASRAS